MRFSLLPLLPLIIRYPFLKPAKYLIEDNISNTLQKEALERAEEILRFSLHNESMDNSFEYYNLLCDACQDKNCREVCEKKAIRSDRNWTFCDLCGECFKICDYFSENYSYLKALAKREVLAYIFSRSAVSKGSLKALRKFSTSMARYYRIIMENDELEKLPEIMASNFNIKYRGDEVHVSDFLKASVKIKAREWKLYNRELNNGFVRVNRKEFFRIIEEFLKEKLVERLEFDFKGINRLMNIVYEYDSKRRDFETPSIRNINCFPPCFKKIISDIRDGLNVPHTARFALASFLLKLNYDIDEIMRIFSNSPDFDEEKARYQIEHIAGKRGSGKEYEVPSCDTMRTYQNCYSNCGVKHPFEFYRRCLNENSKRNSKGKGKRSKINPRER